MTFMQAPGTPQATAAEARAAAQADVARQTAQSIRDQAQSIRDQVQQQMRGVPGGITVQPSDFDMQAMRLDHARRQEKMVFAGFVIVMIAAVLVLTPIARAFARRLEGKQTGKNPVEDGSRDQLLRIEQSIDAMAIEIERISEGQRFTTKLMSGREDAMLPVGSRDDARKPRPG